MDEDSRPAEDGFEFEGSFYRWHVSDMGKDLMLIDRISGLPVTEFFQVVDDEHERMRGPILLTLIATSIRAARPDWSVERIVRTVMNLNFSDVEFVTADEPDPDETMLPPPEPSGAAPPTGNERSSSPRNGSSPSPTPAASTTSETSSATRA